MPDGLRFCTRMLSPGLRLAYLRLVQPDLAYWGCDGLTGLSLLMRTQAVTPPIAAAPMPMAMGELRMPPPAAGAAPAARFLFFFLSLSVDLSD